MRLRAACLAAILVVSHGVQAMACSLDEMRSLMRSSDEHVGWADFWSDLDDRETRAELGYAQSDLRDLGRLVNDPDCDDSPAVLAMRRAFLSANTACMRRLALASRRH
ncbi:MAG: hypothetical protein U1E62_26505 [Alsobacter sp.]